MPPAEDLPLTAVIQAGAAVFRPTSYRLQHCAGAPLCMAIGGPAADHHHQELLQDVRLLRGAPAALCAGKAALSLGHVEVPSAFLPQLTLHLSTNAASSQHLWRCPQCQHQQGFAQSICYA